MSTYRSRRSYEEESSQSSDEKMDTGSESFRSQDTPNSTLSSDYEENPEPNILHLQGPALLQLSRAQSHQNAQKELSDSFLNKMSTLHINSPQPNIGSLKSPVDSNLEKGHLESPIISNLETQKHLESPIISNLETQKHLESPIISNLETKQHVESQIFSNLEAQEHLLSPILSNLEAQDHLVSPILSNLDRKGCLESVNPNLDNFLNRSDSQMDSNLVTNDLFESVNSNLNKTFGHTDRQMKLNLENIDRLETMKDSNLETEDCFESVKSNLDKEFDRSDTQIYSNEEKINCLELGNDSGHLDTKINSNLEKNYRLETLKDSNLKKILPNSDTQDNLESPKNANLENRPKNLGISPPKFSTSLVLTTSHPLMSSPDYPDVVPKKDKEQDLSLSSFEDDRPGETNGYNMYSLNTNNSKNNLYFSENFTSAENHLLGESKDYTPPDVAKVVPPRRKIIPRFVESPLQLDSTPKKLDNSPCVVLGRSVNGPGDETAILKYIEERNKKLTNHSTPKLPAQIDSATMVSEWCESTQIQSAPKFELPIELSSNVTANNELESPDVLSSSTGGSRSQSMYQALADPLTGCVALRPTAPSHPAPPAPQCQRRTIILPTDLEDSCSLDSLDASLESEEEPPELDQLETGAAEQADQSQIYHMAMESREPSVLVDGDETKRSKSPPSLTDDSDPIPEYSAAEEFENERSYISVQTGETHATCDMKVIEPYKRVLSHGGYDADGSAIIVFSACHLPDTHRPDYRYVMDNLFLYVMWTLDRLIGCEYVLVYLHGSAGSRKLPTFRWLHECYRLIDRRIRKSLKHLYLVHPTFWLKSFVMLTKPFISSKFFRKLSYVSSLDQLQEILPVEPNAIPEIVRQYDQRR